MNFIPKFGYPHLCGQALIDWSLKNKEAALAVFELHWLPFDHKSKVAWLQPYQMNAVITALRARFPADLALQVMFPCDFNETRQHLAQPGARPQPQSGEDEQFINVEAVRLLAVKKAEEFIL